MTNPVLDVWHSYVLPWIPKDGQRLLEQGRSHKLASISTAIVIVSLYFAYDRIARPPRYLRHIPRAGFFRYLSAVARGKMVDEIARDITLPIATKAESGIYMVGILMSSSKQSKHWQDVNVYDSDSMSMDGLYILLVLKLPNACCSKWVSLSFRDPTITFWST